MTCVIETYTDELLFTNTGRRSLKVSKTYVLVKEEVKCIDIHKHNFCHIQIIYQYLIRASDWVLTNLRRDAKNREVDLFNLPEVSPVIKPLTHIMFHIEDTCFDQVGELVLYRKIPGLISKAALLIITPVHFSLWLIMKRRTGRGCCRCRCLLHWNVYAVKFP